MLANVLFDWLTFTVLLCGNDWQYVVRQFLRLNPELFQDVGCGLYGYKASVEYAGIRVLYDGRFLDDDTEATDRRYVMGVCVIMSGRACRAFEELSPDYQLIDLMKHISSFDSSEARISRLDIACDDKEGSLNIDDVIFHANSDTEKSHYIKSRVNDVTVIENRQKGSSKVKSRTVYFGHPSSERRGRCYDKAKEQGDYESHWIRFEMVLRGDYAKCAVLALSEAGKNIGACVAGMLRQFVEFVLPTDSNISRCAVAEWWDRFLCAVEAVHFYTKEKAVQSADKLEHWFMNQLGRCVAMARKMFGPDFFEELAADGARRMSAVQRALVQDYLSRCGPYAEVYGQLDMLSAN